MVISPAGVLRRSLIKYAVRITLPAARFPQKHKSPLPASRFPLPAKAATVLLFGVGLEMWKLLQDSSKEDKEALLFSFVLFVRFVVQGFYAFAGSGEREREAGF